MSVVATTTVTPRHFRRSSANNGINQQLTFLDHVMRNESIEDSCFRLNSKRWLEGPRIGNIPLNHPTDISNLDWFDHIMHPYHLLHPSKMDSVLSQTLCYPSGRFRNVSVFTFANTSQIMRQWEFRLLYLTIHRMHHAPAHKEYQLRKQCMETMEQGSSPPAKIATPTAIPNFDYECPDAKFWVIVVHSTAGMGAVLRNHIMPSFFMAIATGRIPLLVQSAPYPHVYDVLEMLARQFPLASCERGDWQCVFLPTSPCVVTLDDLRTAPVLTDEQIRQLRQHESNTTTNTTTRNELEAHRVVIHWMNNYIHYNMFADPINNVAISRIAAAMKEMLNDYKRQQDYHGDKIPLQVWRIMTQAANQVQRITSMDVDQQLRLLRVAYFYVLRPNAWAERQINDHLLESIPSYPTSSSSLQVHRRERLYFGLPIRGSDKCFTESSCLTFDRYMELMLLKWQTYGSRGKVGTILLTSEDPTILPLRLLYAQNSSFPLKFAVLPHDTQQGTGRPQYYRDKADAVMIASLTAIKLQLQANVLVGNCCSNFHTIIFDLVREGCGADPFSHHLCLNDELDMEDNTFRICCGRRKGTICKQLWADQARAAASANH